MCTKSKKAKVEKPESKSIIDINSELPPHIIQVIFAKLPIVNLPVCRLVCKAWNDLILNHASTSKFVPNTFFVCTLYLEFPPFLGAQSNDMWPGYLRMRCIDFDEKHWEGMNVVATFRFDTSCPNIRISNSCNGLLCVIKGSDLFRTSAGIFNPMTNEYIKLPGYDMCKENLSEDCNQYYLYGFGFSPKSKQYKVARVWFGRGVHGCNVEIFTLGKSSQWSHVDSLSVIVKSDGVYFNGALYWVGVDEEMENVICRLDVEDEKFEIISLPKEAYSVTIGTFNGRLYATFWERGDCKVEVWMMGSHRGEKDLWMLEFVVDGIPKDWKFGHFPCRGNLQLIKTCGNGEIIMCLFDKFHLFSYDLKTRRIMTILTKKRDERTFWIHPIESLNFDSLQEILVS